MLKSIYTNLKRKTVSKLLTRSAMCLTVFVYRHGKVKKALFATSKNYPEFAYASKLAWDEQGRDLRIITTDVYDNGFASIASIYTWNRTTGAYEHKRVPFEKRFE